MNFLRMRDVPSRMRLHTSEAFQWARAEFGNIWLGDERRTKRLVVMAGRAAESPSGRITEVFKNPAERQGAYDFLETKHVSAAAIMLSLASRTALQSAEEPLVFVPIDGTSLSLIDHGGKKDFGTIGSLQQWTCGLKVINALAVRGNGVSIGLLAQEWWARTEAQPKHKKKPNKKKRNVEDKETRYWLQAIEHACQHANDTNARLWLQLDREGDNKDILRKLATCCHRFTVRACWDRVIQSTGKDRQYLRQWLGSQNSRGTYELDVPAGPNRVARQANMVVRVADVTLQLPQGKRRQSLPLRVVWTREEGTTPAGEDPIDWLLLTNAPVEGVEDANQVIYGYTQRWRIEDFHKAWKTGVCNVERTQLHTMQAVTLWATLLAAVAVRAERLKLLSRKQPDMPATVELTQNEIRALILLKREFKKRTETIPDTIPTLWQATVWIAELGGYTGKSSGGPPGAITIRRGLEFLRGAALAIQAIERRGK